MLDLPLRTARLLLRAGAASEGDIVIEHDGVQIGHIDVRVDGHIAVLDGRLEPAHRGRGYAAEALGAAMDGLLATPIERLAVLVAPDDTAAMRLVEHEGFRFEGTTRGATLVDDSPVDQLQFALLRSDHADWLARPTACISVELVEINDDNLRAVSALATHKHQEPFVAPVSRSLAQFGFPPTHNGHLVVPWARAVQADGEIVGFLLLSAVSDGEPEPYVWRFLIDRRHQRRTVGTRTFAVLADALRAQGHTSIVLGFVDGPGSPRGFYERLGFVTTGKVEDGEHEARLAL
ncbi:MAG: GNAT family N-acetyltransferase [Ilumatobacteraceae bacterium]